MDGGVSAISNGRPSRAGCEVKDIIVAGTKVLIEKKAKLHENNECVA
jgi:hypothetical protein